MSVAPLHVREAGAGPPVLLLHGWACHGGFFHAQLEGLAIGLHVLAPDLPGHGLTGAAGVPLSIEAAADACADLLAARGLDRVLVVGWSMGAAVAWAMLERHGKARIAGLVVVDMSPRPLKSRGNSKRSPKNGVSTPTYFSVATLPNSTVLRGIPWLVFW